jgi:RimJ/RimL family protein N-acetyltransferase
MADHPVLQTERLILRPPSALDFDAWARFHSDPETMTFLGGPQRRSEAWRVLCTMRGAWEIKGFAMFSMIRRDTGEWIGRTGPWQPEGWPGTEVGWGVSREYAGQGYAREAAVASIDWVFDTLGWNEVIHVIDPGNTASIALAERLGSRNLGPTQLPEPYDHIRCDRYGQSRAEWKARLLG